MADLTCRACGSTRIIPDALVLEFNEQGQSPISISVQRKHPEQISVLGIIPAVKDKASGHLLARLCADCGLAELYSPDAAELWSAYSGQPA